MERARDVLCYVAWVETLLWREAHRLDPSVSWQRDLSWDEWLAAGIPPTWQGYGYAPGEWVANVDLAVELYWPGPPPVHPGA